MYLKIQDIGKYIWENPKYCAGARSAPASYPGNCQGALGLAARRHPTLAIARVRTPQGTEKSKIFESILKKIQNI